ncbi:uncharacterized protein B0I36DRAFT_339614 [Microdochium trichocladiopsis]|uniref:Uncharacterized protein n=1 Tax=Microdochium trichocladiopsis TaxID=1682393 RepID=A0A9P9BHY1_9PEZI|nr:uncharacterized protein B0I36DRAFT_339614 [Microdochium trichocladiopsis]KAH7012550.1 hypothetical protein B0I36DRAFT_339614 [Microdochium trichocladiopsis]
MALVCAVCSKTYQRSTHLRRHEATHYTSSQFACPSCSKTFARRDVCRKHASACPSRANDVKVDTIPLSKRGQKPRACAGCFVSKLACDLGHPCRRCTERSVPCTYNRQPAQDMLRMPSGSSISSVQASSDTDNKASITFLLDMTHPSADTLMAVFNEELPVEPEPGFSTTPITEMSFDQMDFISDFLAPQIEDVGGDEDFTMDFSSLDVDDCNVAMQHTLAAIKQGLLETFNHNSTQVFISSANASGSSNTHTSPPRFDDATADTLLQPLHARILAATYFRTTVPDFPVTHEASFSLEQQHHTTCPELVLAVMMSGSLRCAPHDYVLAARKLMRLSNDFIFARLQAVVREFVDRSQHCDAATRHEPPTGAERPGQNQQQDTDKRRRTRLPRLVMDVLAAALISNSALATVNDASEDAARYLRSGKPAERLHQLASAARECGIDRVRRARPLFGGGGGHVEPLDWDTFVYEESCIRIANWAAMNAWLQAGWLNAQPAVGVAELRADLPCPLELWQARDAEEFQGLMGAASSRQSSRLTGSPRGGAMQNAPLPSSIAQLAELMMGDERQWRVVAEHVRAGVSRIDLIITVIGLHAIILSARLSSTLAQVAPSLRMAITRWRRLWDSIGVSLAGTAEVPRSTSANSMEPVSFTPSSREAKQLRGLHKHAVGLAWLAASLLDPRTWHDKRFTELGYFRNVGRASMADLHELMEACRGLQGDLKSSA